MELAVEVIALGSGQGYSSGASGCPGLSKHLRNLAFCFPRVSQYNERSRSLAQVLGRRIGSDARGCRSAGYPLSLRLPSPFPLHSSFSLVLPVGQPERRRYGLQGGGKICSHKVIMLRSHHGKDTSLWDQ
jgi:hypothetical protein